MSQVNATSHKKRDVEYRVRVNTVAGHDRSCAVCGGPIKAGASTYCGIACYRSVQRSTSVEDRFWAKLEKTPTCWLWAGAINQGTGYGQFTWIARHGHIPQGAHRVAWELTHGPIPPGQWVLHRCDTPRCVNPDHLFLGTRRLNMEDAARKGRLSVPRPSRRALTDPQRASVRARYAAGGLTLQQLADEHRVTKAHIWQIVHKRSVEFRQ